MTMDRYVQEWVVGTKGRPPLRSVADSVYVRAVKRDHSTDVPRTSRLNRLRDAGAREDRDEKRAVSELLVCPVTGGSLVFDARRETLVCNDTGPADRVGDGITGHCSRDPRHASDRDG